MCVTCIHVIIQFYAIMCTFLPLKNISSFVTVPIYLNVLDELGQ